MWVTRSWNRFWFAPQPTSTLVLLRIAFGLLSVVWTLALVPDANAFFAPGGVVDGHAAAPLVLALTVGAAVAVTLGLWTRIACITLLLCLVWLHRVDPLLWNTGDVLLRHVALFLALAPAGAALSVDRWRRHERPFWEFPARPPWALRLVQVQVCLMYVVTVVAKLQGGSWRSGDAVSYILRVPEDARFAIPMAISASPVWAPVLNYSALAIEAAIPVLVWNTRLRAFVLGVGACLHLIIEVTLRVGLFSWVVLMAYLAFVPPETAARFLRRFGRDRGRTLSPGVVLQADSAPPTPSNP